LVYIRFYTEAMRTIASVYQLTPLGLRVCAGSGEQLHPNQTTILQAVNGARSSRLLVARFAFLGDVSGLLIDLEAKHLIAAASQAPLPKADFADTHSADFAHTTARDSAFPDTYAADLPSTSAYDSAFPNTFAADLLPTPAHDSAFPSTQSIGLSDAKASGYLFAETTAGGFSPASALQDVRVREICDLMSDFILAYMPETAFDELADLERIETTRHLMAYLSHYQELLQNTGAPGVKHLAQLDTRVEELLSTA
jgi:hypothetical protein